MKMDFSRIKQTKERLKDIKKEQVMEWVKEHKSSIVLFCFALLVMIAFGVMITGMGKQGQEQEMLFQEEKAQLMDMTTYLDEIEEVVSVNKERLAESSLFQSETEQTLMTAQEKLSTLERELTQIESVMQSHTETETVINNEVSVSLTELSQSQQEIKAQIATVNANISEILSAVRHDNAEHFSTAFDKLKTLQKDLEKTQKDIKSYYEDLNKFLILLQEESEENLTVTLEQLEQLQQDL